MITWSVIGWLNAACFFARFFFSRGYIAVSILTKGDSDVQYQPASPVPVDNAGAARDPVYFPIWWVFLIPLAAGVAFLVYQYLRWSAKRRNAQAVSVETKEFITIAYSVRGGDVERRTFDKFPVRISGNRNADLALEMPKISSGPRSFSIVRDKDRIEFVTNGMFTINGVGRRRHLLSRGDRISFGRYRLVFEGLSKITTRPAPVPPPRFLYLLLPLAVFVVLPIVFCEPVPIGGNNAEAGAAAAPVEIDHEMSPKPGSAAGFLETAMSAGLTGGSTRAGAAVDQRINRFPTVVWEPGEQVDYFKADVLFLHAHPDDETLDFGVMLRRLADSGKRTVVVLFTDGASGLDQYPRRTVGEDYPSHRLCGESLARVREEEAQSAMSILGVRHYVRLGLENNPYSGTSDVLTTGEVIAGWGGKETLFETLSAIILGYKPEIIVSPEGPAAALEHFEHETVGLLVDEVLEKLQRETGFVPKGRLVPVDPRQKGLYTDAEGIRADGIDSRCGLSYRTIQAAALDEHRTQRDASVVGVENLSGFDREYYRIVSWKLPLSIEEYLTSE